MNERTALRYAEVLGLDPITSDYEPMRTLKPLHREILPPRQCSERGCRTWLTSANKDDRCSEHGGWTEQNASNAESKEDRAELLEELMAA